ncbi:FAD/NAD(P)-binding protein [Sphingomonas sp. GCM10030256]|uniref:FAD/NAD(P)-binding protein n=1 Tax=Sphingomonas sp. GCM10030256 TaxID=3273427 RepID=UPI003612DEB8
MRSDRAQPDVAIVGGGFSGTMTAVHLARRGLAVCLIEGADRIGRGVAYSTTEAAHLLNVPAAKMSAWPDKPADFADWLADDGGSFAERRQFGRYLGAILDAAEGVERIGSGCVSAERNGSGWVLRLDDGREVAASVMVLANGNQPPAAMAVAAGLRPELFVNNPWTASAASALARAVEEDGDVLILGTGLTMIDTVLSLDAARHRGRIVALSRRGQIPRAHAPNEASSVGADELPTGNALALCRWLRRRGGEVGWRSAVDSLRPHSQALWQAFSTAEKRRFLRHARPWWDVHRHRIAPQVAQRIASLVAEGRLQIVAGRIASLAEQDGQIAASIVRRGRGEAVSERFALAVNCTGPLGEIKRTADPLLRQLLGDQTIAVDELGMGLNVDSGDRAGDRLWAVGPMTKGRYWEIVAVPDIRGQAAAVAETIQRELGK